ncbi:MAG: small basic family protein [Clostridia bacterium]|nr:small basic family protein [Clostridia bacterium]
MFIPVIGLVAGVILALYMPAIDFTYSKYLAIAVLACLDSVFGGIAALMEKRFDIHIFVSGFFGNALLAVGLTFLGEKLGVDLYLAAVFVFGNRMFLNFAIIRRYLLNKFEKQDNI